MEQLNACLMGINWRKDVCRSKQQTCQVVEMEIVDLPGNHGGMRFNVHNWYGGLKQSDLSQCHSLK